MNSFLLYLLAFDGAYQSCLWPPGSSDAWR